MVKTWQIKRVFHFIRLFTQVSAAVVLLVSNSFKDIPYLVSLMLIVVFANYFRQFYLVAFNKPPKYKWISIAVELSAIIAIGFLDKTGANILLFFACMTEAIVYYEFKYSAIFMIAPFLLSRYVVDTMNSLNINQLLIDICLNYGVSIVFVTGMGYFLRSQIREKEKLARVNGELEEAYKNLLDASSASEQLSIEKERIRMAREIHDTLAHTLTTLIVQLEVCKKLSSKDAMRLAEELEKAQELTRGGLADVKRTIKSLRPQALEGKSFVESILDFINNTMNNTEIHIILENTIPQELKLSTSLEISIFRLIQESITNSIRHGHSKEIRITMGLVEGRIQIGIQDDGAGCTRIKKGFGLSGIQERMAALGGEADFSSSAGNGFETRVSIPLGEG